MALALRPEWLNAGSGRETRDRVALRGGRDGVGGDLAAVASSC